MGLSKKLVRRKVQLVELLNAKYPTHQWEKMFSMQGRFGQQRYLRQAISSLFPVLFSSITFPSFQSVRRWRGRGRRGRGGRGGSGGRGGREGRGGRGEGRRERGGRAEIGGCVCVFHHEQTLFSASSFSFSSFDICLSTSLCSSRSFASGGPRRMYNRVEAPNLNEKKINTKKNKSINK